MCGIVGYIGRQDAISFLLPGLRRLEYRGYDSAGVATINGNGLIVQKVVGKIAALEGRLDSSLTRGSVGIAHTRWATHGRPSDANAHPHVDCSSRLAVVHNGIVENYRELRRRLADEGHRFRSQTDTEVVAHLIESFAGDGLAQAVARAAAELRGAYAIACISQEEPGLLVGARSGSSPLVIGLGSGEIFLASDIPALLGRTREILVLEDGEMALLGASGGGPSVTLRTLEGRSVDRHPQTIAWDSDAAEKGGFPHFMLKEIHEQPDAVLDTLRDRVEPGGDDVRIPEIGLREADLQGLNRLSFVACGTSYHAALIGKYLIEEFARLPVDVEIASEFRHREPILDSRVLTVAVSQSGETADTLAAMRAAKERGARTLAVCNVVGSSASRDADGVVHTRAGLEIGVASTKAFTAQIAALLLLAVRLGRARGFTDPERARHVIDALIDAPRLMRATLDLSADIRRIATRFASSRQLMYLGRGLHYPMALEGALKLKEISYIHAEGHAGGEMKHGPLALVDGQLPVVAIAPRGPCREKMLVNIEEVRSRDGIVIAVLTEGDWELEATADAAIAVPPAPPWVQPLVVAAPLQLFAYHTAVLRGCDVDQPRNLAKSVTVE